MRKLFNRREQKTMRQSLRNHMPRPEQILWFHLRNRNVGGFRFRRQHGIGSFVTDFYCPEAQLAIELDGESHFEPNANVHDTERQRFIEAHGVRVLRFTNIEVREHLEHVLTTIAVNLPTPSGSRSHPFWLPLPPPLAPARAWGEPLGQGENRTTFPPLSKGRRGGVRVLRDPRSDPRGFTLIEILLVIAIIAITAAATTPVYQVLQSRNDLEVAVNAIPPALRRAQVLAQAPDGDTSWGVRIQSGSMTLFQGASYAARDTTLDEVTDITSTVTPSDLVEVVFAKFTGLPTTTGTITLTNVNGTIRNITVNGKGMISY